MPATIITGDCVEQMALMEAESVDAVVCDPPYGLEFMGKEWDRLGAVVQEVTDTENRDGNWTSKPFGGGGQRVRYGSSAASMQEWHETWAREALRVLKPGGHLLAFGGTRTYHRLTCGLEDAGFEIRDCIAWMYGSGFPKSLDVSKAIDKAAGAEREVIGVDQGKAQRGAAPSSRYAQGEDGTWTRPNGRYNVFNQTGELTAPATPDAQRWDGWGTALKPAHEPIVVARKPLIGTVAANVLEHGTGGLNIDGCRIGTNAGWSYPNGRGGEGWHGRESPGANLDVPMAASAGRWPANVVLGHHEDCVQVGARKVKSAGWTDDDVARNVTGRSIGRFEQEHTGRHYADADGMETVEAWECVEGCPVRMLDEQTGDLGLSSGRRGQMSEDNIYSGNRTFQSGEGQEVGYRDSGGASRFFYCAKASRSERNAGLEDFEERRVSIGDERPGGDMHERYGDANGSRLSATHRNPHPTVKPISLMRWLVRLVTPPGGLVLDPFAGSGSTGCGAVLEGFTFIGIERDPEYVEIARARIAYWAARGPEPASRAPRTPKPPRRMSFTQRFFAEQGKLF